MLHKLLHKPVFAAGCTRTGKMCPCIAFSEPTRHQALRYFRYKLPQPATARHFERSRPTPFLHVRSRERVGLRREKSLF
jgi:hypothetical protein